MKQPSSTPSSSNVIFTVPNMNHNLNIKLSNNNFTGWRTQILAYIKGQDVYGFLDGTSQPPAQTILNTSMEDQYTSRAKTQPQNPKFQPV